LIIENYLDFYDIFINEIAGGVWIFIIIALIALLYICSYTNIPFQTTILLSFLFLGIMSSAMSSLPIWTFIVFGAGLGFYFMFARLFRKG